MGGGGCRVQTDSSEYEWLQFHGSLGKSPALPYSHVGDCVTSESGCPLHTSVSPLSPLGGAHATWPVGSERDVAHSYGQATCMQVQCGSTEGPLPNKSGTPKRSKYGRRFRKSVHGSTL